MKWSESVFSSWSGLLHSEIEEMSTRLTVHGNPGHVWTHYQSSLLVGWSVCHQKPEKHWAVTPTHPCV